MSKIKPTQPQNIWLADVLRAEIEDCMEEAGELIPKKHRSVAFDLLWQHRTYEILDAAWPAGNC